MTGTLAQDGLAGNGLGGSLDGKLVAVVGGSGFVGTHLAQELLTRGARLRVVCRHPKRAFRIKPLGTLGQVQFVSADVTRPDTLAAALAGVDAVVNLVGSFAGNLDAVMGRGAGAVASAARAGGALALIHVSAIGADANGTTAYARAKAAGEAAVLAAFPGATVLRPSVLFGPDDAFINLFAGLIAKAPILPIFAPEARFQPLLVDDLAAAIAAALVLPAAAGQTYELGGPEQIGVADLNHRIAAAQGRKPLFAPLPDGLAGLIAAATGWLPGAPITRQQWRLLKAGNVVSGTLPGLADLGVKAQPLGLFLDKWMVRYRKHGRFGAKTAA